MNDASTAAQRAWQLLERCLDLGEDDREAILAEVAAGEPAVAAEVRRLLARDRTGDGFLTASVRELIARPPEVVGPYRLRERLGVGGTGMVFRAERIAGQPSYPVAIKILWRLPEVGSGRWEEERELLGALDHPGICRLLDAGSLAGAAPWIAVELIEGQPIDRYCRERGLDLDARLELALGVLAAVEYAHSMQVIHRDIKPSNVLVDAHGRPRLLDFGIACRLEAGSTAAGAVAFTPGFASPEQLRGERVGPAADVFSLGALLYLLVCERPPFELAGLDPEAMVQRIADGPLPPSEVLARMPRHARPVPKRRVSGDLDAVLARALAARPDDRYASVSRFAEDLERFLRHRPVRARHAGLLERGRLALSRHRLAAAAVAALLAAGSAVAWQAWRIAAERAQSAAAWRRAATVSELLLGSLADLDPATSPEGKLSARELVERTYRSLASRELDAQTRADLLVAIGSLFGGVGAYEPATGVLEEALRLRPGDAATLEKLAIARVRAGDYDEAERLARRALAARGETGPAEDVLAPLTTLAWAVLRNSRNEDRRLAEAERLAAQAVAIATTSGAGDVELARAERLHASVLQQTGRAAEALPLARRALARLEGARVAPYELAVVANEVALVEQQLGEVGQAAERFRGVVSTLETVFGPEHPEVAGALTNLAIALAASGSVAAASETFDAALARYGVALGEGHPMTLNCASSAARAHQLAGELGRAEALHRRVAIGLEASLGVDHPFIPLAWALLAENLALQGRNDEATRAMARATPATTTAEPTWMTLAVDGIDAFVAGQRGPSAALAERLVASHQGLVERLGEHSTVVEDARRRLERYRARSAG